MAATHKKPIPYVADLARGASLLLDVVGLSAPELSRAIGIPQRTVYNFLSGEYDTGVSVVLCITEYLSHRLSVPLSIHDFLDINAATDITAYLADLAVSRNVGRQPASWGGRAIAKAIQAWQQGCQLSDDKAELEAKRAGLTAEQFHELQWGRQPTLDELKQLSCILLKSNEDLLTLEELCEMAGLEPTKRKVK